MYRLFDRVLRSVVKSGNLHVTDGHGGRHRYGDGTGDPLAFRLTDRAALRIVLDPELNLGEAYMDGSLTMERGTVYDMLAVFLSNLGGGRPNWMARLLAGVRIAVRRIDQYNPIGRARANAAHHYDLSGALYDLFLDRDRQYSCAYFTSAADSLEDAQLAKKRHIAAKLEITPGMTVLDIGSGWGGLGLYLAENCGARVTGVTLSAEQHRVSSERARQRGVAGRADFRLLDYRQLTERFDRIVSVGMFEHVGIVHFPEFFAKCRALLAGDGIALVHAINRSDGPGATNAWIKKHIFPGGYIPALSEVVPAIEAEGLTITDIEILRLHYAETIRHWRQRFADHRERAKALFDERFCRMWEFYLAASECTFRFSGMNNFQIQFCRNQHALPLTRDYMGAEEARLRAIDGKQPRLKTVPAEG